MSGQGQPTRAEMAENLRVATQLVSFVSAHNAVSWSALWDSLSPSEQSATAVCLSSMCANFMTTMGIDPHLGPTAAEIAIARRGGR